MLKNAKIKLLICIFLHVFVFFSFGKGVVELMTGVDPPFPMTVVEVNPRWKW